MTIDAGLRAVRKRESSSETLGAVLHLLVNRGSPSLFPPHRRPLSSITVPFPSLFELPLRPRFVEEVPFFTLEGGLLFSSFE